MAVFARWLFFTVLLALMQLWIVILYRFFSGISIDLPKLLLDGALLFYANALAAAVMEQAWKDNAYIVSKKGRDRRMNSLFLYGALVPMLTLFSTIIMYMALLQRGDPTGRIIWGQVIASLTALTCSATYTLTRTP
jgi:hypothetical protein